MALALVRPLNNDKTPAISASDVNFKLGQSSATTVRVGETNAKHLAFKDFGDTDSVSYTDYLNKTRISSSKYYSTIGYVQQFLQGASLGSISDDIMDTNHNKNGWGWHTTAGYQAEITEVASYNVNQSGSNVYFRFGILLVNGGDAIENSMTFTTIKVYIPETEFEYQAFPSSYASWSSLYDAWMWNDEAPNSFKTLMGYRDSSTGTNIATRFVEIE